MKKYTEKFIKMEAAKYQVKGDFTKSSPGAYGAAKRMGILSEACSHMPKRSGEPANKKWTFGVLQAEAALYSNRKEFAEKSWTAYRAAVKTNKLDQICSHMSLIRMPPYFWTFDTLKEEALKYETRGLFIENASGAYDKARTLGILEEICAHMRLIQRPINFWNFETLKEEALKYKTRALFIEHSAGAYCAARRFGISEEIFAHMEVRGGTSAAERILSDSISTVYPKARKLRDRKVSILNKPHIKGFEIDIYVPELRKGIEFDGTYWHSVRGLQRSRKDWPEADLSNYAEIKDLYFQTKGIDILHIDEKDWTENPQKCIDKCLNFLGAQ